jgi:hypothetical protein
LRLIKISERNLFSLLTSIAGKFIMLTKEFILSSILTFILITCFSGNTLSQIGTAQDNPLLIQHTNTIPVINGIGSDQCWQSVTWQPIGQIWIPYNGSISQSDYSGRYKVIWSSEANLLYFLIEINDDVFVDGYQATNGGGTGYNYDISEVFIDENHSGGEHRYDGNTTNAENAFAYHMFTSYPADGEVNTVPYIEDMAGTQANSKWVVYNSHFPEFALRKSGNTAIREFSLIVYNDTYSETNKEASRAKLLPSKVIGLSVAYCDNDGLNESPKVRDNMFGSVNEPSPGNLHWMNADYFGTAILSADSGVEVSDENPIPTEFKLLQNYPNPFNPITTINYSIPQQSNVTIGVYDFIGKEVALLVNENKPAGSYSVKFDGTNLSSGLYLCRLQSGVFLQTKKILLLK